LNHLRSSSTQPLGFAEFANHVLVAAGFVSQPDGASVEYVREDFGLCEELALDSLQVVELLCAVDDLVGSPPGHCPAAPTSIATLGDAYRYYLAAAGSPTSP
jgi:hypothetical protein